MAKQRFVECDVFCAKCGKKIDHLVMNKDAEGRGYAEALIIGSSRSIHMREDSCEGILNGNAWTLSPYTDVIDKSKKSRKTNRSKLGD